MRVDSRRTRRRSAAAVLALVAITALPVLWTATHPWRWGSDALFYEAKRLELRGLDRDASLQRVFSSDLAREVAAGEDEPYGLVRVLDPEWVEYTARFYDRRLAVPGAAAAVTPVLGDDSLPIVGLVAYLFLGPVLFFFLRRRFSVEASFAVALVCLLAPPVARWATHVGVDGWGMTLQVLAYLGLALVLERGLVWLPLWMASMAALSLTRDTTVAIGLALAVLVAVRVVQRRATARHAAALGAGALAALPAPLLISAPLRDNIATVVSPDSVIPTDTSWGFILRNLPGTVLDVVQADFERPLQYNPVVTLGSYVAFAAVLVALAVLVARCPRGDDYFAVQLASLGTGVIYLLMSPNFQSYRLELVFLPAVAVALAFSATLAWGALGRRGLRPARAEPA
jgi:hypothetical protein